VPRENFFGERHRARRCRDRRNLNLALQAREIEIEQAAMLDDLARDVVLPARKFREFDFFAAFDFFDHVEICRNEQSQVLRVLLIDAFDIFRDDHANARAHFRVRRRLAAGSFAASFARDRRDESAVLDRVAFDRKLVAAFQTQVRKIAERLVVVITNVRGRDLVGLNVVAQFDRRIPSDVLTGELPLDQIGVFGEEQDAPVEFNFRRLLFDCSAEQ